MKYLFIFLMLMIRSSFSQADMPNRVLPYVVSSQDKAPSEPSLETRIWEKYKALAAGKTAHSALEDSLKPDTELATEPDKSKQAPPAMNMLIRQVNKRGQNSAPLKTIQMKVPSQAKAE